MSLYRPRSAALVAVGFLAGLAWGEAERRALRRRLAAARHAATHDPLTRLPNRAGFARDGAELLARAAAEDTPAAVLLFDLDGFKPVNDRHGHAVGDKVLEAVAARLDARCTGRGAVARLGGDEFAAVVIGQHPVELAAQLGADVAGPIPTGQHALSIGASIGLVMVEEPQVVNLDLAALLARADSAMYRAKAAGGGVAVYDSTTDHPSTPATRPAQRARDIPRVVRRVRQLRTSGPNGRTTVRRNAL